MKSKHSTSNRTSSTKTRAKKSAKRRMGKKVMRAAKARKGTRRTTSKPSKAGAPQFTLISGAFTGDITSTGHVCFSKNSKCKANVKAGSVQVEGDVAGNVFSSGTLKLGRKSHVNGNIVAQKLSCADGATFVGRCMLGRMKKAA